MRLEDLNGWVKPWQPSEMFAGVPGKGAVDAWRDAITHDENMKIDGKDFCGAVADIAKFFDQVCRELVLSIAKSAGMPTGILIAYGRFLEDLVMHNCIPGGIGKPHKRRCGIPQGCPFSMAMASLLMRPGSSV